MPFKNKEELYLSVFVPSMRKLSLSTELPENYKLVNKNINNLNDYVDLVEGSKTTNKIKALFLIAGITILVTILQRF